MRKFLKNFQRILNVIYLKTRRIQILKFDIQKDTKSEGLCTNFQPNPRLFRKKWPVNGKFSTVNISVNRRIQILKFEIQKDTKSKKEIQKFGPNPRLFQKNCLGVLLWWVRTVD